MNEKNEQKNNLESKGVEYSLQERLNELEKLYKELAEEQHRFASDGDLSENKDWETVRERREIILWEIEKNRDRLANMKNGTEEEKQHQQITYLIMKTNVTKTVYLAKKNEEKDPKNGLISQESPLGSVLINAKENDIVMICGFEGISYEIKILKQTWITMKK